MNQLEKFQLFFLEELKSIKFPTNPENLYNPISYFLEIGGKRMRPILALMGCELFDKDFKKAINIALSVELFHNFTLIHDDIMDNAPLRRGKKTIHEKWNSNIAILSGDTLFVKAYEQLSNYSPEILHKIFPIFNKTAIEVCEGQQLDMDFESRENVTIDEYLKMIQFKTAVLLGASLKMGAIVGGANEKNAQELYAFGVNLGIAFQLQDDILDVYASQNSFGKQVGGDIIANKKTYLLLKAIEDSSENELLEIKKLFVEKDLNKKIEGIRNIYQKLDIRSKSEAKMNEYYEKAMVNLKNISVSNELKQPLIELSEFLMVREV